MELPKATLFPSHGMMVSFGFVVPQLTLCCQTDTHSVYGGNSGEKDYLFFEISFG